MSASVDGCAVIEEVDDHGPPRVQVHVQAPASFMGTINPIIAPPRYDAAGLPGTCAKRRRSMPLSRRYGRRLTNWMQPRVGTPLRRRGAPRRS